MDQAKNWEGGGWREVLDGILNQMAWQREVRQGHINLGWGRGHVWAVEGREVAFDSLQGLSHEVQEYVGNANGVISAL